MINNIIRANDNLYFISRILSESTTEEQALKIHHNLGTDTLLRDKTGKWFCCVMAKEASFKDVEIIPTEPAEDLSHTQFELNDNGGLG
jgi:hypothetical protein